MFKMSKDRWDRIGSDYRYITSQEEELFYQNYIHGNQKIFEEFGLGNPKNKKIEESFKEFQDHVLVLIEESAIFLKKVENEFLKQVNQNLTGTDTEPFHDVNQYRKAFQKEWRKGIKKDPVYSAIVRTKNVRLDIERKARNEEYKISKQDNFEEKERKKRMSFKDQTNQIYGGWYNNKERAELRNIVGVKFRNFLKEESLKFDKDVITIFSYIMDWYKVGMFNDKNNLPRAGVPVVVQKLIDPNYPGRNVGFLKVDKKQFIEIAANKDKAAAVDYLIEAYSGYSPSRKELIYSTLISNEANLRWGARFEEFLLKEMGKGGSLEKLIPIQFDVFNSNENVSDLISVEFDIPMEKSSQKIKARAGISVKLRIHDIINSKYGYSTEEVLKMVLTKNEELNLFSYLKANYTAFFGIAENPWMQLEKELAMISMIPRFLNEKLEIFEKGETGVSTIFVVAKNQIFSVADALDKLLKKLKRGYKYKGSSSSIEGVSGFKSRVNTEEKNKVVKIKDTPSSQKLWWEKIKILNKCEGRGSIYNQFLDSSGVSTELQKMNEVLRAPSFNTVHYIFDLTK